MSARRELVEEDSDLGVLEAEAEVEETEVDEAEDDDDSAEDEGSFRAEEVDDARRALGLLVACTPRRRS